MPSVNNAICNFVNAVKSSTPYYSMPHLVNNSLKIQNK